MPRERTRDCAVAVEQHSKWSTDRNREESLFPMNPRTLSDLLAGFALAQAILTSYAAAIEADARAAALESITKDEVKHHVDVLADDTFEGREAGSRGNRAAGLYIIEDLKKYGIPGGAGDGKFYQTGPQSNSILAIAEGRDPELKNEVILVGAHYDHVGYGTLRNSHGPIGYIHNGADDNASGVAALLEVAQAVSRLPERPKRTILFAFWDGEEKGLWGSKYWIEHPTIPLDHLRVAINVDMVGRLRNSKVTVYGARTAPGFRRLVSRQNAPALLLDFDWDVRGDSDHYSFFNRNIPFIMLHTGLHDDYHRPSDDVEKINNEGLKEITRLIFGIVVELADAPQLGSFRSQSRSESNFVRRGVEVSLSSPPGRLGVRWDEAQARNGLIVVRAVTPDSAADRAGIRPGDRIISFDKHEVHDARQFRMGVLAAESPAPVSVAREGEEEPLELSIQLPGSPVRLGIAWRVDQAEPACVIVNRLTPGSPADMAGLRPGDRIHRICGRDFSGSDEFRELAHSLPNPLVLEVETGGRVRAVTIPSFEQASQANSPAEDGNASSADES